MATGRHVSGTYGAAGYAMYCWICDNPVVEFACYGVPRREGRCPHCGAKPRGRLLAWFLREVLAPTLTPDAKILEVGPSRFSVDSLLPSRPTGPQPWMMIDRRITRAHRRIRSPHRFVQMDVAMMGFRSKSFDLILCNNILPYVEQDLAALGEIARCLKTDGLAVINTHTGTGPTLPVPAHRRLHPELGDDYYAENGDQWVYGEDFFERVTSAGLGYRIARLFENRARAFLDENGLKHVNECILAFNEPDALQRCLHPELRLVE